MSVAAWIILTFLILAGIALITLVIVLIVKAHENKAGTGREDLKGSTAIVKETLNPEGTVFIEGELWNARSESGTIETGQEVIITEVRGCC
jgi:membrane-bound serine protease (ClpP class)